MAAASARTAATATGSGIAPGLRRAVVALALALAGVSCAADTDELPAPLRALESQGVVVQERFDAPAGLTGYAATFNGQPMALYLTADGEHVIVGTLLDAQGRDLTGDRLAVAGLSLRGDELWAALEATVWVRDGDADAPRVVYTFTDPYCPFCHRFWEATRPWVDAGQVQLRHVLVGVIRENSAARAAAMLEADDPAEALNRHIAEGGTSEAAPDGDEAPQQVEANNRAFDQLGFSATPTTLYRDGDQVIPVLGLPDRSRLEALMGGPPR